MSSGSGDGGPVHTNRSTIESDKEAFEVAANACAEYQKGGLGNGSPADKMGQQAASAARNTALAGLQFTIADLKHAAALRFPSSVTNTITAVRGNQSWGEPTHFKTVELTGAEWLGLRDALSAERIAASHPNRDLDNSFSTDLAGCRAEAGVISCSADVDSHLATAAAAFELADQSQE